MSTLQDAAMASVPSRLVSSYCTEGGCPLNDLALTTTALNAFSITSYYVSLAGDIKPCSSTYAACNWTDGTVGEANQQRQDASGALAQPLVFSNSGDMVRAFSALVARPDGIELAASFLGAQAASFGYRRVQLDLEPSCWAANASTCRWPRRADALNYVRFVNATADALSAQADASLSVAIGTWPESQCTPAQYTQCGTAADDAWADACEAGSWDVDVCNCCAYALPFPPPLATWHALPFPPPLVAWHALPFPPPLATWHALPFPPPLVAYAKPSPNSNSTRQLRDALRLLQPTPPMWLPRAHDRQHGHVRLPSYLPWPPSPPHLPW